MNPLLKRLLQFFSLLIPLLILILGVSIVKNRVSDSSRASRGQPQVYLIKPMLHPCYLNYLDCNNQPATATISPGIKALSLAYDLNPNVLLTLAHLAQFNPHDQTELTLIAQTLNHNAKALSAHLPLIIDHPVYGLFRLDSSRLTDHLIVRTLFDLNLDPAIVNAALSAPNNRDGQIIGFVETYRSLFNKDPLN